MKAVRAGDGAVAVVDLDEAPGFGTELLTIKSASVCASDLSYIKFGSRSIIGHEICGVADDGAAYTLEGVMPCYECEVCLSGRTNLCPTHPERAVGWNIDGGMAEQYYAPARNLVPLPVGIAPEDAAIVEPATVAWHALRLANTAPGMRVAVVGAGAIGLLAAAGALEMGAEVSVAARHPHQQEAAERIGAKVGTSGQYDVVIEAAGSESSLQQCIDLLGPHGTVSIPGVHYAPVAVNLSGHLFHVEGRIIPSMGYATTDGRRDMAEAAAMLAAKPDVVDTIITHRFPLEDAPEAFRVAADKSTRAIRVVLSFD
jgi:threonine dehydrogenase-like Zn-dependent dehydrogenase